MSEEAFYLTISIFDNYLNATKYFDQRNIFLLGLTCLYISSKMEDILPLRTNYLEKLANNALKCK